MDGYALSAELAQLPTVTAELFAVISTDKQHYGCEGPAFDREGNLYVCHVAPQPAPEGRIVKISPDGSVSTFYMCGKSAPVGLAFHRDGRLFAVCLTGEILIISPDGGLLREIRPSAGGENMRLNDCVFDMKGNFYFTDFRGPLYGAKGGVYRYDAQGEYTVLTPILTGMSWPNGISFNCAGDSLYIGEGGTNCVVRILLDDKGFASQRSNSSNVIYRSTGLCFPDSNKMDSEDNLYQAIMDDGRIVVLNRRGIPVGNVLVPGRSSGHYPRTSNLAIKPGTDDAYMLSAGPLDGTAVLRFKALASAQKLYGNL